ncbi:Crp/Fnr family transcriptional regulator [Microbispora hainanensis]|jgi:CRP-like cAMP-binding protein|uniref:Crp/Fnr family transcriptional regulator n=1 Tax=Microbispora hainanensis TaxID=568844 RepID=A0ABZ1SYW9_9ACTN|nr:MULTISPECIES: Crp/Fnr family transcriptional regulator [Microbispora]NJP26441.1 Crp/Fnr family transcriptional regulator [Microbispora sp. CL1-1]TQS12255.1 Crp/Fnr family transcriptional regulator [Microbispora sp. SCL1-1]
MRRASGSLQVGERLRALCCTASDHTSVVRLNRNEHLYVCGEQASHLYIIISGRLKTVSVSRSGKECLLGIHTYGDLLGESCLLGGRRGETVTAMTPATLRKIPRANFLSALADDGLLEDFLCYLAHRLTEQQQVITSLVTADSEERLAHTLLRLARKLGTPKAGKLCIHDKITQEELSGMVGTTRSRVGYFLKRFRDSGLIESRPDAFLAVDEERLGDYMEAIS